MNKKIEQAIIFIREAREEAEEDGIFMQIMMFFTLCVVSLTVISFFGFIIFLAVSFPKQIIPVYIVIALLWIGYNRL